ncbi:MAG: PhoH family protein [Azospirillaceae bacterium]
MTAGDGIELVFDDNRLVPLLYGEHDRHLKRIEHLLGVTLVSRGNRVRIVGGGEDAVERARKVLDSLYERLTRDLAVGPAEIDAAVRLSEVAPAGDGGTGDGGRARPALERLQRPEHAVRTRRRLISPRTVTQGHYIDALAESELVFGLGPAGTGKTYLAVARAVELLADGRVDRLILSRPAVEAGEKLGFLPGDLREKVDPYLRPLYDALYDMLPGEQVARHLETGTIEVAPLAFMRGRTLANAFIILDEAQNTTSMQMRMFLTRMGENSRMAVTGDISQTDLPAGVRSGLREAVDILDGVEGTAVVRFSDGDVVRHPMVTRIVRAYEALDARTAAPDPAPARGRGAGGTG